MPRREEAKKARSKAFRYLAYRDRSRNEISRHLKEKGFSPTAVEETLVYLEQNNYVNDPRFALQFGRSRIKRKRVGKRRLRRELSDKGLDRGLVDRTLDTLYGEHDEQEMATVCAEKKLATYQSVEPDKKRNRLAKFLERQGFPADVIYGVINRLVPR